jgi:hypothetical protein
MYSNENIPVELEVSAARQRVELNVVRPKGETAAQMMCALRRNSKRQEGPIAEIWFVSFCDKFVCEIRRSEQK